MKESDLCFIKVLLFANLAATSDKQWFTVTMGIAVVLYTVLFIIYARKELRNEVD
jgi:hypothetical protein